VAQLEKLALSVGERTRREQQDFQTILDSGLFRRDYACPPHLQVQSLEVEVRAYVRAWASGIGRRKPYPGFHPGIYQERQGLAIENGDPFAHYLRAGRPDGVWNAPVIEASATPSAPSGQRVALHVHVHYPELLSAIVERLVLNKVRPDLFISINREEVRAEVEHELQAYGGRVVEIALVPNRGRDIGPFVSTFLPRLLAGYDVIGHLHTKKSVDVKDASVGQSWYRFLLENLIGGVGGPMMDRIMARLAAEPSIGMVFPDDPNVLALGANRPEAELLARRMGFLGLPEHLNFPVGSMFWAKKEGLEPLACLNMAYEDYPEEPLPYDGTLLHAMERLFPLSLNSLNMCSAGIYISGVGR
jgi:lipopolysaccharide biosynthesis protein